VSDRTGTRVVTAFRFDLLDTTTPEKTLSLSGEYLMSDHHDVERLNFVDLDVEALERRLELVEPGTAEGYYCYNDNTIRPACPVQPAV
jgi:hypothetical protein